MPELPEVETIRRQLHARLAGKRLVRVEVWRSGREAPAGQRFVHLLERQVVRAVERRAKLLIFRFTNVAMVGHLKMTGKFVFVDNDHVQQKHDRILFRLCEPRVHRGAKQSQVCVVWSDVRQFGYLKILTDADLERVLAAYGPEPLETSAEDLAERLCTPVTRTIKAALLDQATIAGVGNIYTDEACHRAGVRPTRRLGSLTQYDRLHVAKEVQNVLRASLKQKGTSANDYVDTAGERGGFLRLLRVYGRVGKPCRTCKTPIKKIVLAGRGTHYCPRCQK